MRWKAENTAKIPHPGQGFASSARRMVMRLAPVGEAGMDPAGNRLEAGCGKLRLDLRVSHSNEHP
jgi:hypothetical protein